MTQTVTMAFLETRGTWEIWQLNEASSSSVTFMISRFQSAGKKERIGTVRFCPGSVAQLVEH